jgi:hypothetical protein
MTIPLSWSEGPDPIPLIALRLIGALGPFASLSAILDTGWAGELYLGHRTLRALRLEPERGLPHWLELNPEPSQGRLITAQLPCWRGLVAIAEQQHSLKVAQGLRGMTEQARLGRGALRSFGLVAVLDFERRSGEILSRRASPKP